jgi:hypothetical protein
MKVATSPKAISTDYEWLKCSMPSFPISDAVDNVTKPFPDSSGRSPRATSLTSYDSFNPLGHSPCCLIPPIRHATFTVDSPFNFRGPITADLQRLIAAVSVRRTMIAIAASAPRWMPRVVAPCSSIRMSSGGGSARAAVHGTYRGRLAAHEGRTGLQVSAVGT